MATADLTPELPNYLSDAQLAALLTPGQAAAADTSSLATPVNLQSLYAPMMMQQINQQAVPGFAIGGMVNPMPSSIAPAASGIPAPVVNTMMPQNISRFARGGPVNAQAEELLEHDLYNDPAHLTAAVSNDKHFQKMFGFGPPSSRGVAYPSPQAAPPAKEDLEDTLSQYDTPVGQDYLAARRKIQGQESSGNHSHGADGGSPNSLNLHDLANNSGDQNPQHFATGGRVKSVLHRFKNYVPSNGYVATPHYRQTLDNPGLTKVRTNLRTRYG